MGVWLVLAVWIVLALTCYHAVLVSLVQQWQINSSFSHGPIVIPIALGLLWVRRRSRPKPSAGWLPGLGILVFAHALHAVAQWLHLPSISWWTLPIWVIGWVGWLAGSVFLRWSLPAIGMLCFMIPPPFQVEQIADRWLQLGSAQVACWLTAVVKIPAVTDGFTLWVPSGQIAITEDCSGLGMSVSLLALLYVLLFGRVNRHWPRTVFGIALRLVASVSAALLAAIVANATRIAAMAFVIQRYGNAKLTDRVHEIGDWFMLPLALLLVVMILHWMRQSRAARRLLRQWIQFPEYRPAWQTLREPLYRVVIPPLGLGIVAGTLVELRSSAIDGFVEDGMQRAIAQCSQHEFVAATETYQTLIHFHPDADVVRLEQIGVCNRMAQTTDETRSLLLATEDILRRKPFDVTCLRTHLDLALRQNDVSRVVETATKLMQVDAFDSKSCQLCLESVMRFPSELSSIHWGSKTGLRKHVAAAGSIEQWYPRLILEACYYSSQHPDALGEETIARLGNALAGAVSDESTSRAFYSEWCFRSRFQPVRETDSLDRAFHSINSETTEEIACLIYLALAEESPPVPGDDKASIDSLRWLGLARAIEVNSVDVNQRLGEQYAVHGQYAESAACFLRAWRLSAGIELDIERRVSLGVSLCETLVAIGQADAARSLANQLHVRMDRNLIQPSQRMRFRLSIAESRAAIASGDYEQAIESLRSAQLLANLISDDQSSSQVRQRKVEDLRAQCLVKLQRYDRAARLFESRATRVEGQQRDQWVAAARAWRRAGNASQSIRCYGNALQGSETLDDVWLEYIHLLYQVRGKSFAVDRVEKEQHRVPKQLLAQAWEIVGKDRLATQLYEKLADDNDGDVSAYAISLARDGSVNEALLRIADERWRVDRIQRAHTAAVCGIVAPVIDEAQIQSIQAIIDTSLSPRTDDAELHVAIAQWYARRRLDNQAIDHLQRALSEDPYHPVAGNNLAMLLADRVKDFDGALQSIDRVLERYGSSPEFLDTRGWILFRMDRVEESVRWLNRAVRMSMTVDPVVQLHLAAAYLENGDENKARETLQIARELDIETVPLHASEKQALERLIDHFASSGVPRAGEETFS